MIFYVNRKFQCLNSAVFLKRFIFLNFPGISNNLLQLLLLNFFPQTDSCFEFVESRATKQTDCFRTGSAKFPRSPSFPPSCGAVQNSQTKKEELEKNEVECSYTVFLGKAEANLFKNFFNGLSPQSHMGHTSLFFTTAHKS